MVSEKKYMVVKEGRVLGLFEDFIDAFKSIVENKGGEIYRVELISKLGSDEVSSITEYILTEVEPVEIPLAKRMEFKTVVFDPSFSLEEVEQIVDKYRDLKFIFNSGRAEAVSSKDLANVLTYDVAEEEEVIDFLKSIPQPLLFVTRSKRLYVKSSKLSNVKSIYITDEEDVLGKINATLGAK